MTDRMTLALRQPNPPELDARVEAAGRSHTGCESLPEYALATGAPGPQGLDREQSDAHLVALARTGDDSAFEAIVERYEPLLLRHCRRLVKDDAEDAVQQAFVDAWSALRRGCEVRDLRPWLFTIAHRAALQSLRQQGERCVELSESFVGGRSPVEQVEQSVRTRAIFAAIAKLPDAEQEALVSISVQGRTGSDTATALGVSEGAVRQLVFRARTRVRAAVRVFLPPVSVFHPLAIWNNYARRVKALVGSAPNTASSPTAIGVLTKVSAVVAAGFVIGTPVAALSGVRTRPRIPDASDHAAQGPSTRAARLTPKETPYVGGRAVTRRAAQEGARDTDEAPAPSSGAITARITTMTGGASETRPGRQINAGSSGVAIQLPRSAVSVARKFTTKVNDSVDQLNGDVGRTAETVARVVHEVPTPPPGLADSAPAVLHLL
jgi:RNA polymerase sigma factor (sigma-70 family)